MLNAFEHTRIDNKHAQIKHAQERTSPGQLMIIQSRIVQKMNHPLRGAFGRPRTRLAPDIPSFSITDFIVVVVVFVVVVVVVVVKLWLLALSYQTS